MAQGTIHNGSGTQRGVVIALVVIAIFVAGMAWLGSASAPGDQTPTPTTVTE